MGGDAVERFADRAEDYARFRPEYPEALFRKLRERTGLPDGSVAADFGCGTGIFARGLIDLGWRVIGVEPEPNMRAAADRILAAHPHFMSIDGTAESTRLAQGGVDLVTAAQAFHWFDAEAFRRECRRILTPNGWCALAWNARRIDDEGMMGECHELYAAHIPEYPLVCWRRVSNEVFETFFGGRGFTLDTWPVERPVDRESFEGGCRSASYMPKPGQPGHDEVWAGLREIFDRHAVDGRVTMRYRGELYVGRP